MTTTLPDLHTAAPDDHGALTLKSSTELARVPAPLPPPLAVPPVPTATDPMAALAQNEPDPGRRPPKPMRYSWLLAGVAALASVGWVIERRRRRLLETEKDSVMWADVQPPGASIMTTTAGIDDILPDNPNPAEAARAIYVTAIGETSSRREATLIDLHQLEGKLMRRHRRGDIFAAVLLLQQHLVDFRYTSPWVFLELLELYKLLDRRMEWDVTRQAFRHRFGQNAPAWDAASTVEAQLLDDPHLCSELAGQWPQREARMFLLRWMLGELEMRQKCSGPPLLPLGVYRDLMLLDSVLDDVIVTRPVLTDSLL